MTLLYYSPEFLEHQTGQHPERPERLSSVWRQLERTGLSEACTRPEWQPATESQLLRVHSAKYLTELREFAASGGGRIEEDTVCGERSPEVAFLAAGAVADAVTRVVTTESTPRALCLVRPPGHHALRDAAMGFCLVSNVAVAARLAVEELSLDRVLIVDWDVHHGNGTQAIFWKDPRVGFFSIHRWPFYPGTGDIDETGSGAGLGGTVNLPIRYGTSREAYLESFRHRLEDFSDRFRPQLVLVSAGFDAHRDDPVGSLDLETEDFISLTQIVSEIAKTHAGGRIVSVLEGGYNTGVLAGCVEVHLRELMR